MTRRLSSDTARVPIPGQPAPGDVLGGKYRVERELGSGGMGVVFEVTHLVMTKTRFAVKWLLPLPDGEDAVRRFRREARISGAIRHPHVVEVYDVNVDPSGAFMVMELLEGESLAARIERAGGLSPSEACTLLVQCLSGVAAAHAAGVIHRDLKPANIFLCAPREGSLAHPKVLDFGVSRAVPHSDLTDTTHTRDTIVGTPAYMSPEQLRAQECDCRTDVYALGVTLYEALTGRRPYEATSAAELSMKILTADVEPLGDVAPDLPAGLAGVVMRAMHKDADERYPTADAFASALRPYAFRVAAVAPPPLERRVATSRSRWLWVVAAALAASAVAAFLSGRERDARSHAHIRDAQEHAVSPASAPPPVPTPDAHPSASAGAPASEPAAPAAQPRIEAPQAAPNATSPAKSSRWRKPQRPKPEAAEPAESLEARQAPITPTVVAPAPPRDLHVAPPPPPTSPRPKPALKLEDL